VSKNEAAKIKKIIKNVDKNGSVEEIIDFVKRNNGLNYASETASAYSKKAMSMLTIFPDTPSKTALQDLVDFVIDRKN
jgi:octaprenyl-diphosphate synthase